MRGDKVADPGGGGKQLPGGTTLDQLKVLLYGAVCVSIYVHATQVAFYQRYQAWELTFL